MLFPIIPTAKRRRKRIFAADRDSPAFERTAADAGLVKNLRVGSNLPITKGIRSAHRTCPRRLARSGDAFLCLAGRIQKRTRNAPFKGSARGTVSVETDRKAQPRIAVSVLSANRTK